MAFYDSYSAGMARRPSFHGTAYSDPLHHGSYDDTYLPRQGYGEYQQYSGQTAFPAYQPPPPLVHQPFSVPREHQPSQLYSPDGDPHGFIPPSEPIPSVPSMHQRRNSRGPSSFHGMPPRRPVSPSMPPSNPIHEHGYRDEFEMDDDPVHRIGPEMPSIHHANSFRAKSQTPFPQRPAYGPHHGARHHSLDFDDTRAVPAYAGSYEDSPLHEPAAPYFDAVPERARTTSGGFHGGPPGPLVAPPLGSYPSKYRSRRSSTPGPFAAPIHMNVNAMGVLDGGYMQRTGHAIAFRAKGAYQEGLSLADATADVRLSKSIGYAFHQLHLGHRGRMMVRVRWNGYRPLNYEIPVTGYEGMVNMQSLARRLARAIVHFLQTNGITIPWDRVIVHRLEEETHGVWLPIITTV